MGALKARKGKDAVRGQVAPTVPAISRLETPRAHLVEAKSSLVLQFESGVRVDESRPFYQTYNRQLVRVAPGPKHTTTPLLILTLVECQAFLSRPEQIRGLAIKLKVR